jgi:uncharacterized protein YdaU (DUF1376 family)
MSLPRMSLHIGDYKRDTGHLRATEHGAYLLLIMHYWATGGLPDDDRQLATIACLTDREWKQHKPLLQKFFSEGWKHKRVEFELKEATEKYERSVANGKKGGRPCKEPKAEPRENQEVITGLPCKEPDGKATLTLTNKEEKKDSRRIAVATAAAFEEFWQVYPKREGDNPKKPAAKKFLSLTLAGTDPQSIIESAKRYAANCDKRKDTGTRYVAQAVTWLNQERFTDYSATAPEPSKITKPRHGQVLGPEFGEKATGRVFVLAETPEWDAWCAYIRGLGKPAPPRYFHEGWAFATLWPPGYEPQSEAAE